MTDLPADATTAAYAAYQKAWLTRNQNNPLFAENVVSDVLEAAAPHIRAAERHRIRQLAEQHAADCTESFNGCCLERADVMGLLLGQPAGADTHLGDHPATMTTSTAQPQEGT